MAGSDKPVKMIPKYKEGETVYAKVRPDRRLTVKWYVNNVYYCIVQADPLKKELVYFERELMSRTDITS
jgi:hypothetical protein